MRKVNICHLTQNSGLYNIYIDSDHQFSYSRKRDVDAAFVALNSYFTKALYFLNGVYTDVFTIYRNQYFIIENPFIYNNIKRELEFIESSIDLALNRSHWDNGNSFTLRHIENIYSSLFSILLHLKEHAKKRSDTATVYLLDTKFDLIKIYYNNFLELQLTLNDDNKTKIETIINKMTA